MPIRVRKDQLKDTGVVVQYGRERQVTVTLNVSEFEWGYFAAEQYISAYLPEEKKDGG